MARGRTGCTWTVVLPASSAGDVLALLLEATRDAVVAADAEGRYVDVNRAACEVFGLPRDEILGRRPHDFADPSWDPETQWSRFLAEGRQKGLFPLVRRDGERRLLAYDAVAEIGGTHWSVMQDVTVFEKSGELLDAAFRLNPIGMTVTELDGGTYLEVNEAFVALTGYSREELIGRRSIDLGIFAVPAEREVLAHRIETDGIVRNMPVTGVARDGRRCPVLLSAQKIDVRGRRCVLTAVQDLSALRDAEEARDQMSTHLRAVVSAAPVVLFAVDRAGRFTLLEGARASAVSLADSAYDLYGSLVVTLDGGSKIGGAEVLHRVLGGATLRGTTRADSIVYDVQLGPLQDRNGAICGAIGVAVDVTHQHRLSAQLEQAQKLESLGRLSGSIAHDFNNILAAIQGFATLARESFSEDDPAREDVDEILDAADRAARLTRHLLAFSRKQALAPRVVSLDGIVEEIGRMIQRLLGETVELVLALGAPDAHVLVDAVQLEQVLVNLAVNARDAMPQGGRLTIASAEVVLGPDDFDGVPAGRWVRMLVSDTGTGMDAETLARAFEPFFTTKGHQGTGLGLATVYGTIKQSGGHVFCESVPGEGTTFEILLPYATRTEASESAAPERQARALTGSELVLVVEDNHAVRKLVVQILSRNGYRVIEAASPGEALLIGEQENGGIDLLLTDVVMPRLSGPELARRLRETRPELKILFITGYSDEALSLDANTAVVHKPFSPTTLLERVRGILDSRAREAGSTRPPP